MYKKENGVTMLTLVIMIIILLILAGVTIKGVVGGNGILDKTISSKTATEKRDEEERLQIMINNYAANELTINQTLKQYLDDKVTNGDLKTVVDGETISVTVNKYTFDVDPESYEIIEE